MDASKIKSILQSSSLEILSKESFSERLGVVYDVIDRAFPSPSFGSAIFGPITDLVGYQDRTEVDILLQIIKESSSSCQEYSTVDKKIDGVLSVIYSFVRQ